MGSIIYLTLSTIDTEINDVDQRTIYKATMLKSCLSKSTLQAALRSGMTTQQLKDPALIIAKLKERCSAGRNNHVRRQQFQSRCQRKDESVEDWLCDLRDLATKADFATGCCALWEPGRLLGQVIFGVHDDEDKRRLLEKGAGLTLDQAVEL